MPKRKVIIIGAAGRDFHNFNTRYRDDGSVEVVAFTAEQIPGIDDRIYPAEATLSMVGECDYLVITLPLTDQTHHLVDDSLLRAMNENCFLVNVGRGSIVDEKALIKALKKGWIAGAGLDVFETEPLPAESPLWQLDNVILSPHVSGFTPIYDQRATDLFCTNLDRYLKDLPLLNLVDRQLGY